MSSPIERALSLVVAQVNNAANALELLEQRFGDTNADVRLAKQQIAHIRSEVLMVSNGIRSVDFTPLLRELTATINRLLDLRDRQNQRERQ